MESHVVYERYKAQMQGVIGADLFYFFERVRFV
jgi:hypothetical protein